MSDHTPERYELERLSALLFARSPEQNPAMRHTSPADAAVAAIDALLAELEQIKQSNTDLLAALKGLTVKWQALSLAPSLRMLEQEPEFVSAQKVIAKAEGREVRK